MKTLSLVVLIAVMNVVFMLLFAASKLGPTPAWLPLLLSLASLFGLIFCFVRYLRATPKKLALLFSAIICLGLVMFNLFVFQSILYVA